MKTKGIYFLYRVVQALALPLLLLYFLARGLRNRGYWRSLPERFGFLPHSFRQTAPGSIWLHAVSVGEVLACLELARRLRAAFPHARLFVSTSTIAGRATAGDKLRGLADGVFYAPVDYVWAVRRVLRALRPSVVLVAETEIWPNLFREVHRTGAGLAIVNGRISDRALPRYRRWRAIFPAVLAAVDSILAQTEEIRSRFVELGAPPERVRVAGNFKYDFEARAAGPESPVVGWIGRVQPARVWIAASTMPPAEPGDPDEDDSVIAAWLALRERVPDLALILVPRKPERFDLAAAKLAAAGIAFERRSALGGGAERVLLLDTIGELGALFAHADVVFMGGTLAHRGGHNILEPALFGKAVITGPHMENFQAIADDFRAAGAVVTIDGADALAAAVERTLRDPGATGERARECALAKRGATDRAVEEARALYRIPRYRPAMPWYALARGLAAMWRFEARRRAARNYQRRRRLPAPVISVGNLSMGGSGKTPCVLRLVELLRRRGRRPAILTRGYGRTSPLKSMVLPPGACARPETTGDEPQIFLRSGLAPVGIGADRFETGTELLRRFDSDVILLDDGFQHVKLARDVDVVLIDGVDPLCGNEVFPVGRLREPAAGLARAHAIVITRSDVTDLVPAIERAVRRVNPVAPIVRAHVEPEAWVEQCRGTVRQPGEMAGVRAGAFCGLGNPQGFRRTLERIGVSLAEWVEFDDHHRYTPDELRRIARLFQAAGATVILTTQKDAVNLCDDSADLLAPLPLYWLKIGMRFDDEAALMEAIGRVL
ncbi:MAG: tetraacyldisaccharide 4'-kinase [Acidobacteria bacterium]|nr:tetraacyldisaccharide 4'-kinase [Acidobacteriota bacterium]